MSRSVLDKDTLIYSVRRLYLLLDVDISEDVA